MGSDDGALPGGSRGHATVATSFASERIIERISKATVVTYL